MRCAIYARYSSDLQRDSSIEDQIRKCREYASSRGWTIQEQHIRCDRAVSAGSMAGRDGLTALMADAKQKPRPFDYILIDDTSRLARNLEDSLRTAKQLDFYGVKVFFVSQGIDSGDKSSRTMLTMHGMMDEQFIQGIADKVHRGQEGQVLKGLQVGGRCYGYRNSPIEDKTRMGKYGRPAVTGVRLQIEESEAAVIRRIFDMYASGAGLAQIAKILNAESVVAPQPSSARTIRAWCVSSLHELLRNERYRGVSVWNRTEKKRNPETGRKVSKARPESDWIRKEVPEWRIVSGEQWAGVQERLRFIREKLPYTVLGGLNRTVQSRTYLFSGLLVCSECDSRMVIVSGGGKRGYVKYGCPAHRYKGVCGNRLTIRRDRLEAQLLNALDSRFFRLDMAESISFRASRNNSGRESGK
jgi:site-specific DNA recombinase